MKRRHLLMAVVRIFVMLSSATSTRWTEEAFASPQIPLDSIASPADRSSTALSETERSRQLLSQGKVAFKKQNWIEAEEFFTASLAAASEKSPDTLFLLARCQLAQKHISESAATLVQLEALEGTTVRCLCIQALSRFLSESPTDAIHVATQAISLDPNHRYALYVRGMAHFSRREYEDALNDFEDAAVGADPDFGISTATIHLKRAQVFDALKQYPESVAAVSEALETEPSSIDALVSYWHCQRRDGYTKEALSTAQRALEAAPKDPRTNSMCAISYAETGNHDAARICAEQWHQLEKSSQSATKLLCQLHHTCGDSSKALDLIGQMLTAEPDNSWAKAEKALILATATNEVKDIAQAQRIASTFPVRGELSAWCALVNAICWIDSDLQKAQSFIERAEDKNASNRHKSYLRQIKSRLRLAMAEQTKTGI